MKEKLHIIIIHGTYGSPRGNWFPWLASEVEKLGCRASVPRFPTPKGQNLDNWRSAFIKQVGSVEPNMVLVGHSLGPGFILNLLEESSIGVRGTFLVSGFLGKLGLKEFDTLNRSFVCQQFKWTKIRRNAGTVKVYNSDNDPYVPLEKGYELAEKLGVKLTIVRGGGHINSDSGHDSFPQLLQDLKDSFGLTVDNSLE